MSDIPEIDVLKQGRPAIRRVVNAGNGIPFESPSATNHAVKHQNGGSDEVTVLGLSGLLADDQHVLDAEVLAVAAALVHASRHTNGADDIQDASVSQKGLATAAQITKLTGINFSGLETITVGTVAPTSPTVGDIWINTA